MLRSKRGPCWEHERSCWDHARPCWEPKRSCWDHARRRWDQARRCWEHARQCWDRDRCVGTTKGGCWERRRSCWERERLCWERQGGCWDHKGGMLGPRRAVGGGCVGGGRTPALSLLCRGKTRLCLAGERVLPQQNRGAGWGVGQKASGWGVLRKVGRGLVGGCCGRRGGLVGGSAAGPLACVRKALNRSTSPFCRGKPEYRLAAESLG